MNVGDKVYYWDRWDQDTAGAVGYVVAGQEPQGRMLVYWTDLESTVTMPTSRLVTEQEIIDSGECLKCNQDFFLKKDIAEHLKTCMNREEN